MKLSEFEKRQKDLERLLEGNHSKEEIDSILRVNTLAPDLGRMLGLKRKNSDRKKKLNIDEKSQNPFN